MSFILTLYLSPLFALNFALHLLLSPFYCYAYEHSYSHTPLAGEKERADGCATAAMVAMGDEHELGTSANHAHSSTKQTRGKIA